jgi:phage gpG-like protein
MPKLTGALAGSVASSVDGDTVNVTADVVYAGWIEFGGTRGRPYLPAGRYLTPTVAAAANQVGRMVTQQTSQTIGGFGWSHTS